MRTFHLVLYIVAALAFLVAFLTPALPAPAPDPAHPGYRQNPLVKVNLIALGLLAWICVPLSALIEDIAD